MKKLKIFLAVFVFVVLSCSGVYASYNPSEKPNNIFGIHILFPTELEKAKDLVNSNGGDWGYVTIPIQYSDRNLELWQKFMDDAKRYHLIPIIRVATEPYYANTGVWRKPNDYDIVDFANFLNSLNWPTKNRYVLLFNEVNRFDEWGGEPPSPEEYADFVDLAVDIFKSRSSDFFVIAGGFDNASPNDGVKYMDNLTFLRRMGEHNPNVFKKIDGFSSHSYPNPNFAEAPSKTKEEGTSTYIHELEIVDKYAESAKPVFITETGWNADVLPQSVIAKYFQMVMNDIWGKDSRVIAVTPFVLESNGGPFDKFTFYKGSDLTAYGKAYQEISKKKGQPVLSDTKSEVVKDPQVTPAKEFKFLSFSFPKVPFSSSILRSYFKTILAMN